MLREQFRSQETWAAGKRWSVDPAFVAAAFKDFKFPVIESMNLRFTGSVTTGGTFTLENYAHASVIGQSFKCSDKRGDRVDASTRGLRILAQQELGIGYQDAADIVSSGTITTTSYEANLPIIWHPERSERPNDFLMTVEEFLDCNVIWLAATANPISASTVINSGTLEFQVNVRENYTRDAPMRMEIREVSSEKLEETFAVEGALRYALLYAYSSGSDMTSLSTYTEVDSRTLRLHDMPSSALVQMAQIAHPRLDDADDEVTRLRVIPLTVPDYDQHGSQLAEHGNRLHIKLQAALPTGGKLLTCAVTNRNDSQTAKMLGYASVGTMLEAAARGEIGVVTAKGVKPLNQVAAGAAAKFPWRRLGV